MDEAHVVAGAAGELDIEHEVGQSEGVLEVEARRRSCLVTLPWDPVTVGKEGASLVRDPVGARLPNRNVRTADVAIMKKLVETTTEVVLIAFVIAVKR